MYSNADRSTASTFSRGGDKSKDSSKSPAVYRSVWVQRAISLLWCNQGRTPGKRLGYHSSDVGHLKDWSKYSQAHHTSHSKEYMRYNIWSEMCWSHKYVHAFTVGNSADPTKKQEFFVSTEYCLAKRYEQCVVQSIKEAALAIEWIQCDSCSSWYHSACLGLSARFCETRRSYCPCHQPSADEDEVWVWTVILLILEMLLLQFNLSQVVTSVTQPP